jgi:hypothetical protein
VSSTRELLIKKIENDAEKNCYCENKGCLLNKEYKVGAMSLVDLIVELDEKLKRLIHRMVTDVGTMLSHYAQKPEPSYINF